MVRLSLTMVIAGVMDEKHGNCSSCSSFSRNWSFSLTISIAGVMDETSQLLQFLEKLEFQSDHTHGWCDGRETWQGMNRKLTEVVKPILVSIIQKIRALRDFWRFLKNPRGELNLIAQKKTCPDLLKNQALGEHKFIKLPGLNLHYVESGSKNQELLVFVHGFPDFWFTWRHQIAEFSRDYWVVAVDMRGCGDTEKIRKVPLYKINLLVEDLRNLVLGLGREKFTLIAHDWGGVVGHYFIRIHPQMLNKYILMNTVFHPKLSDSFFSDFKQFLKSWYILIMQIPCYGEYFFLSDDMKKFEILYKDILTPEELKVYKFMFGSYEKIRGPINYYRANFKEWKNGGVPTADELNRLNVPGLYIHGDDDFALTENMAFKKSFQDVKNARHITIPNAGHFVHIRSPEEVNKTIRTFLE